MREAYRKGEATPFRPRVLPVISRGVIAKRRQRNWRAGHRAAKTNNPSADPFLTAGRQHWRTALFASGRRARPSRRPPARQEAMCTRTGRPPELCVSRQPIRLKTTDTAPWSSRLGTRGRRSGGTQRTTISQWTCRFVERASDRLALIQDNSPMPLMTSASWRACQYATSEAPGPDSAPSTSGISAPSPLCTRSFAPLY
jgi:hypothetical protein